MYASTGEFISPVNGANMREYEKMPTYARF